MELMPKNKKGGVVTNTVMGIGALVIAVVVIFVVVSTIVDSNLVGDQNITAGNGFNANRTVNSMFGNFTDGVDNVSGKIPTILLIVAVVFLFGALVLLVSQARNMGVGGGGSL